MAEKASSEATLWLTALSRGVHWRCRGETSPSWATAHCHWLAHLLLHCVEAGGVWRGWGCVEAATEMCVSRVVGEYRVGGRWGGAYALL